MCSTQGFKNRRATNLEKKSTLEVKDLRTYFFTKGGVAKAVDGISFSIEPGKVLGLVGESGSGKTVTGFSILGLVDQPGRVVGGEILYRGEDLNKVSAERMRELRGVNISMIFQDPMMTLNPVLRIDTQMIEAIRAHENISKGIARQRARDALGQVGIASPDERLRAYPHQFSGGMRQRVAIAIALLNKPDLIVADEPTRASITLFSALTSALAFTSFFKLSLLLPIEISSKSLIICSTSLPTYPTSVNLVASTLINGACANFAKRLAISVFPTPVGPIIRIFLGRTSSFKEPSICCLLHLFLNAIATALLAST